MQSLIFSIIAATGTVCRREDRRSRTHRSYTQPQRPGWTWQPVQRQRFHPFEGIAEQLILSLCIAGMLSVLLYLS